MEFLVTWLVAEWNRVLQSGIELGGEQWQWLPNTGIRT